MESLQNNIENANYNFMFTDYSDVVGVQELSKMLGIGIVNSYKLLTSNSIKHIKIGRIYKIPKKAVIDFIYNN